MKRACTDHRDDQCRPSWPRWYDSAGMDWRRCRRLNLKLESHECTTQSLSHSRPAWMAAACWFCSQLSPAGAARSGRRGARVSGVIAAAYTSTVTTWCCASNSSVYVCRWRLSRLPSALFLPCHWAQLVHSSSISCRFKHAPPPGVVHRRRAFFLSISLYACKAWNLNDN